MQNKIIPGYTLIADKDLQYFFNSENGSAFHISLQEKSNDLEQKNAQSPCFLGFFYSNNQNFIADYQDDLKAEPGFIELKKLIFLAMLQKHLEDFCFINSETHLSWLITHPSTSMFYERHLIEGECLADCLEDLKFSLESDPYFQTHIENNKKKFIEHIKDQIKFLFSAQPDKGFYSIGFELFYSDLNQAEKLVLIQKTFDDGFLKEIYEEKKKKENKINNSLPREQNIDERLNDILKPNALPSPNGILNSVANFFNQIADVQFYYQLFGLRSGNEVLNFINYWRIHERLALFNQMLFALNGPLNSFFNEYLEIYRYEQNHAMFLLRAFMPIFVMTCFVAFAFSLMVPFAMHAVIEFIMLIPTLYSGMIVASCYVDLKNTVYEQYIVCRYGSKYEQPLYQTNDRLVLGFSGNQDLAENTCMFFKTIFQEYDNAINLLAQKHLSSKELVYQQQLIQRKEQLKMLWFYIHDNQAIGHDKIIDAVYRWIIQDEANLNQEIETDGKAYIASFINCLEKHLSVMDKIEKDPEKKRETSFFIMNRWSLFKPDVFTQHLSQKCQTNMKIKKYLKDLENRLEEHEKDFYRVDFRL